MPFVEIKIPGHPDVKKTQKGINLLLRIGEELMSTIQEFIAAQNARADRQDAAIARIEEKLNAMTGGLTPQDQADMENLQGRAEAITLRLEQLAGEQNQTTQ